jgi:hydroxypyruvate isomerase
MEDQLTISDRKANLDRRYSAHIGYLFAELPLADRFAAARRCGFAAVEHPDLYDQNVAEMARLLSQEQLAFAWTNLPSGDRAKGERGFASLPGAADRFGDSLERGLDLAEAIGSKSIHPMAGIRPDDVPQSKLWGTYIENIGLAADMAAKRGITVVIEPLGEAAISGYFMDSPETAARALAELGRPNVKVLLDVYHSLNSGQDPFAFILSHSDLLGHVHIADHPGRHEPGTGSIDFNDLFLRLDQAGYSGFIGCEYVPAADTEGGLQWMSRLR